MSAPCFCSINWGCSTVGLVDAEDLVVTLSIRWEVQWLADHSWLDAGYNNIHILLISPINHFQTTKKSTYTSFLILIGFMNTYISIITVCFPQQWGLGWESIIIFCKTASQMSVSATDASQSRNILTVITALQRLHFQIGKLGMDF